MANSANFAALLSQKVDEVEKPKPLPEGTYTGQIMKFDYGQSKEKKTDYVEFLVAIIAAGSDIDAAELEAAGGLFKADGSPKTLKLTFYITDGSLWRLTEFLKNDLGINEAGIPTQVAIEEHAPGKTFLAKITHRPSQKEGGDPYPEISQTAAVE